MTKKVNPQQALDDAAENMTLTCFCAGSTCSGCEANTKKIFKAGALSPEAMRYWEMNSPAVKKLVTALHGALEVMEFAYMSNYEGQPKEIGLAKEALKAWDDRETPVATNPSDSECATTRNDDE